MLRKRVYPHLVMFIMYHPFSYSLSEGEINVGKTVTWRIPLLREDEGVKQTFG
jgi:hypothetical protein